MREIIVWEGYRPPRKAGIRRGPNGIAAVSAGDRK
jgi:hypothetical protein